MNPPDAYRLKKCRRVAWRSSFFLGPHQKKRRDGGAGGQARGDVGNSEHVRGGSPQGAGLCAHDVEEAVVRAAFSVEPAPLQRHADPGLLLPVHARAPLQAARQEQEGGRGAGESSVARR